MASPQYRVGPYPLNTLVPHAYQGAAHEPHTSACEDVDPTHLVEHTYYATPNSAAAVHQPHPGRCAEVPAPEPVFELTTFMLGLTPYVVVQITAPDPDSGADFNINVRGGGGLDEDGLIALLGQTLVQMTGIDPNFLLLQINTVRLAAGKQPLKTDESEPVETEGPVLRAANEPIPFDPGTGPVPGYVAGWCGHRVAESEWQAGFRTCERCPTSEPVPE